MPVSDANIGTSKAKKYINISKTCYQNKSLQA